MIHSNLVGVRRDILTARNVSRFVLVFLAISGYVCNSSLALDFLETTTDSSIASVRDRAKREIADDGPDSDKTTSNANISYTMGKRSNENEFSKSDDHEGGTWYLGKRSFFIGVKGMKQNGKAAGAPWIFGKRPTTPATPAPTVRPAADFVYQSSDIEDSAGDSVTTEPPAKRSRSPWGFHRSTKAAWYLGKRSNVLSMGEFTSETAPDYDSSLDSGRSTDDDASSTITPSVMRMPRVVPNSNRVSDLVKAFVSLKEIVPNWHKWYYGKRLRPFTGGVRRKVKQTPYLWLFGGNILPARPLP